MLSEDPHPHRGSPELTRFPNIKDAITARWPAPGPHPTDQPILPYLLLLRLLAPLGAEPLTLRLLFILLAH